MSEDRRGNPMHGDGLGPWGVERFRKQCANFDWLQRIDGEAGLGGPWLVLFGHDFAKVTREVAEAGRLPEDWHGNWMALGYWLRAGMDAESVILPAIQRAASRPGYVAPASLDAFDADVSAWDEFRSGAPGGGRH